MEDGRSKVIIDRLIDMIENGQNVTFSSGKVAINKDEALILIRELESVVNGELKMYRDVNDRKGRIINDAKKEAEDIVYEAEQTASRIRVTKRMSKFGTGFRADGMDEEEKLALRTANDIYAASVIYTDEMLTEVTDMVAEAYDVISNQYGRMVDVLEEKARLIAENKAELMSGLRELSKEDRYSQIMELSQLLANELYNEKHRQREIEEYEASSDSAFGEGVADFEASEAMSEEEMDYIRNTYGVTSFEKVNDNEPKPEEDISGQDDDKDDVNKTDNEGRVSPLMNAVKREEKLMDKREKGAADELSGKMKKESEGKPSEQPEMRKASAVEEKILEKNEVREVDADGIRLLHPVNQFENKKDPIANTLNMFKRGKKDGE